MSSRAVEHGSAAYGASLVKPGFCFAPEDDLAFALGFPHMKLLADDDTDPSAEADRILRDGYPYQEMVYGREAAVRVLRATFSTGSETAPLVDEEAARWIAETIEYNPQPFGSMFYFLLEAFVGPDVVAGAILRGLERVPIARWISHPHQQQEAVDALGLVMLRLLPAERDRLVTALTALHVRVTSEARSDFDVAAAKADVAVSPDARGFSYGGDPASYKVELHRQRALQERIDFIEKNARNAGFDAIFGEPVVAPPRPVLAAPGELVRARRVAAKDKGWYTIPDPRLVFLGGEEVHRVEVALWSRATNPTPPSVAHRIILQRFGKIRSPLTVELALDMSVRSRAKSEAKAWFAAHEEYALPVLEELARGSSKLAKAAQAYLGSARA